MPRYEWGDNEGAFFESKSAVKPYRPELLQGSDSSDTSSDSDASVEDADLNVGADEMRRRKALRCAVCPVSGLHSAACCTLVSC